METISKAKDRVYTADGSDGRNVISAPGLDLAQYRPLAGDLAVSDEDFDAFLRTLAEIMDGFVQNAWDVRLIPAFLPEIFDDPSGEGHGDVTSGDEEEWS